MFFVCLDANESRDYRTPLLKTSCHTSPVIACDWLADGLHFVTASWDRTACLVDSTTAQVLQVLSGHDLPLSHVRCALFYTVPLQLLFELTWIISRFLHQQANWFLTSSSTFLIDSSGTSFIIAFHVFLYQCPFQAQNGCDVLERHHLPCIRLPGAITDCHCWSRSFPDRFFRCVCRR